MPGIVPRAGFGHELSLSVEKASPSPALPACSWLLLPCRGAEDPLPAGKAGPSFFFIFYFLFLMHFCATIPRLKEKRKRGLHVAIDHECVLRVAKPKSSRIHPRSELGLGSRESHCALAGAGDI